MIRNFGLYTVYLFGMSTEPAEFECRTSPEEPFLSCSHSMICESARDEGFEYQPVAGSFINWFVTMDFVCENPQIYNAIASYYFIGYLCGIIFFWMPDYYGRRPTMCFLLPNYVIFSGFVIFGETMLIK